MLCCWKVELGAAFLDGKSRKNCRWSVYPYRENAPAHPVRSTAYLSGDI
jgi:hypothetical protein